ncbi:MAG: SGNH/GDSL hydrolase family protein [Clostridia bacterium]|nr:SGNH/GDSL hydrolase family protein [Clostridia bacterium]
MKKIMFTGDSVTDCNRGRPIGELTSLGGSYVSSIWVQEYAKNIRSNIHFYNSAISGNTSSMLRARWESDVLAYPSDYILIMIGINDCWREFDAINDNQRGETPEEFHDNIKYMIESSMANGSKVVLISPFFLYLNKKDFMRAKCDKLNAILKELSAEYDLGYIDVQSKFDKLIKEAPSSYVFSTDRVHPNAIGKQVIANAIMESKVWKKILSE